MMRAREIAGLWLNSVSGAVYYEVNRVTLSLALARAHRAGAPLRSTVRPSARVGLAPLYNFVFCRCVQPRHIKNDLSNFKAYARCDASPSVDRVAPRCSNWASAPSRDASAAGRPHACMLVHCSRLRRVACAAAKSKGLACMHASGEGPALSVPPRSSTASRAHIDEAMIHTMASYLIRRNGWWRRRVPKRRRTSR